MLKRAFDFLVATMAIICLSPVLLALAIAIRIRLGSPVIFRQIRPGLHGEPFEMMKFRTMTDRRDSSGQLLPDRDRITPFGVFLRETSLDELPGLFNVWSGNLSLVGPRPLLMQYLPLYSEKQARRHEVKPGLTGWAQIHGRNAISWEAKFALDIWYVDNRSFWLDLQIIFKTMKKVLLREGVSASGEVTMPVFQGNTKPDIAATEDAHLRGSQDGQSDHRA